MTSQTSAHPKFDAAPNKGVGASLRLENLHLNAGGKPDGRMLIGELSLSMNPGERWVLLGPNGAGKSTLLVALAGLLSPNAGCILMQGRQLTDWPGEALAKQRAWCPQFWLDPFPVSAWETVACALFALHPEHSANEVEGHARRWLTEFDVGHLADTDVRMLSGGERQRVALATACAQGAPLLLLDEPSSHLDWSHQALLQARLKAWAADGGTVLAAVHDLNLAWTLATHALLLDGKGGAVHGTRDEVLRADALSAAYGVPVSLREENDARWFRVDLENPT
ncbi:ABC transporter ATP-binding protein [Uliginosibacterium sp. 31-16]|uniref:ABC transporter ATP-binding protein n=1 Tax=Uliginosibacterium sp. 31-16 TaxID=3068315 RepID=UPI00273E4FA8|nr:ABC transporter ATP-binding protein [Uliginosibacterium sp. 31-16]MDP5239157.1 ABC transporter ATP-binding protein [Uliginosibacterium sp. 31-16]